MFQLATKHNDPELKLGWAERIGFGMASCGRGMLTGVLHAVKHMIRKIPIPS